MLTSVKKCSADSVTIPENSCAIWVYAVGMCLGLGSGQILSASALWVEEASAFEVDPIF